jgi:hypothetical protein
MSHRIKGKGVKKRGPGHKVVQRGRLKPQACPPHEYEGQDPTEGKTNPDLKCGRCGTLISRMVYSGNIERRHR